MDTVWVLGDQIGRKLAALATAAPRTHRVLMVESRAKLAAPRHRQRLHLVIAAMRRFAAELEEEGFAVDYRRAATLAAGLAEHRRELSPGEVVVMEPASWDGRELLRELPVTLIPTNQFLTHPDDFAQWAADRASLRMEDFYRWQRRRLGYLMDGDQPVGGRWNFDQENRRPPPGAAPWPPPTPFPLDDLDHEVVGGLPASAYGEPPQGWWPTTRAQALERLEWFVTRALPHFGPHQDAMLAGDWHLAHSLLSPALNIGLLHPAEVCDRAAEAFDAGEVPIASAEGFIRQIIGWREYVWGVYWLWMPEYEARNELAATRPLFPAFTGADTELNCLRTTVADVRARGYAHHIQRLMVLGNLALLGGVEPRQLVQWMWRSFVDGAEWVMLPNVIGMALHADGGMMATKPYASGGAYINRMSDYCGDCRFDPKARVGEDACPFTSLYWDFLARHRDRLASNRRMLLPLGGLDRLGDLPAVRARAADVLAGLDAGEL